MINDLINNVILPNMGFLYLIGAIVFIFSWMLDLYREGVKTPDQEVRR